MRHPSPASARLAIITLLVSFSFFLVPLWSLSAAGPQSEPPAAQGSALPSALFAGQPPVSASENQDRPSLPNAVPVTAIGKVEAFAKAEGNALTTRSVSTGQTLINFQNGRGLSLRDISSAMQAEGIDFAQAQPLSLASDDFNADGFPDLACGYAAPNGGFVLLYYGDERAFAPKDAKDLESITQQHFPVPFKEVAVVQLSDTPDFLFTGDFDRNGSKDILAAAKGSAALNFLLNDAHGNFAANSLSLPGQITTVAAGPKNQSDDWPDVFVGINGGNGPALLSYEAKDSILNQPPVVRQLRASADSIALGRLDDDDSTDVAIAAGGQLYVLHGKDHSPARDSAPFDAKAGKLETVKLPFGVNALAVGDFIWDRDSRMELAVAADDGSVQILMRGELDTRPLTAEELSGRRQLVADVRDGKRPAADLKISQSVDATTWKAAESTSIKTSLKSDNAQPLLTAMLASGQQSVDLLTLNPADHQINISYRTDGLNNPAANTATREFVSFASEGEPVAALPMRLNVHSRPSLVVLRQGSVEPVLMFAAPTATFNVTKTADTNDGSCSVADCSLREAVVAANATGGLDMITFAAGLNGSAIQLTRTGNDNTADNGDLDINDDVTIMGNGAANTLLQGSSNSSFTSNMGDKFFGINQDGSHTTLNVTLQNLTVRFTRNDLTVNGTFTQTGGAMDIFLTGNGSMPGPTTTVTNCTFDSNASLHSYGGAINIDSGAGAAGTGIYRGTVQFTGSTISNNKTLTTTVAGTDNVPNGGGLNLYADKHNVTFTNCSITGNQTSALITANGGGINMRHSNGGTITLTNTAVDNNTSGSDGGGILIAGVGFETVNITGGSISGNTAQGTGDSAAAGGLFNAANIGGSTMLSGVSISNNIATAGTSGEGGGVVDGANVPLSINNCTITGNSSDSGGGVATTSTGGTQTTTITNSVITGNTGTTGGALFVRSGIMNASLNYINSNTATTGSGIARTGGTATVEKNWWGCDGFPSDTGCQTGSGTFDADPRIDLRLTAAPTSVLLGGTSTLTADVTKDTNGANTNGGNAPSVLVGRNLVFNAGPKGSINAPLTVAIPANGMVAKTFTANTNSAACGAATPSVTLDNGTQPVTVQVQCPNLTATKSNNVSNSAVVGQQWTWTITVTNGGDAAANFANTNTILSDNLPNSANISYGSPTPSIGNVSCTINGTKDLTCTATGPVTLAAAGGNFNVQFTAVVTDTPPATVVGPYANPRSGGAATVDPNDAVVESNEGDNAFSNTVTVNKASTSVAGTSSQNPSVFGQSVTFTATVAVTAPGAGAPTGTVNFLDGGNPITGCQNVTLTSLQAQCMTGALAVTSHTISAAYSGSTNFNNSSGNMTGNPQVVNKANTSTGLTSSLNPANVGQPVTFTATINVTAPGAGSPSGTFQFLDGGNPITGCTSVALQSGQAQCQPGSLSVGNHTITAAYSGDGSFNTSTGSLTGNPQVILNTIIIGDVSIAEGATGTRNLTFTITLGGLNASSATTVHYQTADNTATAPADYIAVSDTILTIPSNTPSGTFTVQVKGDTTFEGNENFFLNLSNPSANAVIIDTQTVATIADDEPQVADLSGDGLTDAAIWNSNNGNWWRINSGTSAAVLGAEDWGRAALGDIAVPGDYDFDNKIDIAVFRPSEGNWYILQSSAGTPSVQYWGQTGDIAVPGDYDADGRTDLAVYRPSEGKWYVKKSAGGTIVQNWGIATDKPVVGDYDGDGKTDLAVFRPAEGNWYIINSSTGTITIQNWGLSTDKLVPGDYDGDGRTDLAVYRSETWFIKNSNGGSTVKSWGNASDLTVPGDYDGDGRFDISIWRPSEGKFYTIRSSDNTVLLQTIEVGGAGVVPIQSAYLPQ